MRRRGAGSQYLCKEFLYLILFTDIPSFKGTGGKWQTPHQKQKTAARAVAGLSIEVGDAGIWVTCARGMDSRAIGEARALCDEVCNSFFLPEL
jgi:hypothetical protein